MFAVALGNLRKQVSAIGVNRPKAERGRAAPPEEKN